MKKAKGEVKIYGLASVQHFLKNRKDQTIRAYLIKEKMLEFSNFLKWCAQTKRAYHLVTDEELTKITSSNHHEGVCVLAREQKVQSERDFLLRAANGMVDGSKPLVFLDKTANPHNIGTIMRSMAHFDLPYLLLCKEALPKLGGSLTRVSKGGSEYIQVIAIEDPPKFFEKLFTFGFHSYALAVKAKKSVYKTTWRPKAVFFFGHEVLGLSKEIAAIAQTKLTIPGSGLIDSLNVSVSCGVVFSSWASQRSSHE